MEIETEVPKALGEVKKVKKAGSAKSAAKRAYRQIYQAWPIIVAKCVEQAEEGSLPHAKFLMEWAQLESPEVVEYIEEEVTQENDVENEPSLAEMFMKTLAEMKEETD